MTSVDSAARQLVAARLARRPGDDGYVTVIIDLTPVLDGTGRARLLDLVPGVAVGLDAAQAVQLYDLGRAIAEGRPVAPDFRDGLAVDRCLAAIEQSSAQRRWVDLTADHPPLAIARST